MKPEAASFYRKANKMLSEADVMLKANLFEAASRNAYLAAFNAARAFIYEESSKSFRSHTGLRGEFARLLKDDARMDTQLKGFLGRAYNFKLLADYEEGPESEVSEERASALVVEAKKFVLSVTGLGSSKKPAKKHLPVAKP